MNYSLNAMEIHNARFDGEFKKTGEWISDLDFFNQHGIFSSTEIKRMQNVRFCLTFLITAMSTYFNRDEPLEEYLEEYNDELDAAQEYQTQFVRVVGFIDQCRFPDDSRVWKKADLFTAIVELHRALFKKKIAIEPNLVANALNEFYLSVDSAGAEADPRTTVGNYYKAALEATNDRGNGITRGDAVQAVIENSFKQGNIPLR